MDPSFLPEEWVRVRRDGRICARSFDDTTFGRDLIEWFMAATKSEDLSLTQVFELLIDLTIF